MVLVSMGVEGFSRFDLNASYGFSLVSAQSVKCCGRETGDFSGSPGPIMTYWQQ